MSAPLQHSGLTTSRHNTGTSKTLCNFLHRSLLIVTPRLAHHAEPLDGCWCQGPCWIHSVTSGQTDTPMSRGKVGSVSELLRLLSCVWAAGSGQAPAACQLSSGLYCWVTVHLPDWSPLWRARKYNGTQGTGGREERELSTVWRWWRGNQTYGWRELWQRLMFPLW